MSITKRVLAIAVIFIFATIAWAILGATIFERTYGKDESLRSRVGSSWGTAQFQGPPTATLLQIVREKEEYDDHGHTRTRMVDRNLETSAPLDSTRAEVGLELEHRQKGLLWYSTYKVGFTGDYALHNPTAKEGELTISFPFPAEQAMYDDLQFLINGAPVQFKNEKNSVQATLHMAAGDKVKLRIGYKSQGLDQWQYRFGDQVSQVRDFHLNMTTNFKDIDFPENTLSPTEKVETGNGWQLKWDYTNLLSGYQIGMVMPEKLQPGPLAGRISLFAPVSLFFFFFLVFIVTTIRGIDIHPMNYFFLAAAFFAFHLLMAYLVDHVSIHLAFIAGAVVSLALVISYMRLVAGPRFALIECGLAQLVYLVGFSYAFFFKGFTGLAVTIGSIVTLFVVMQMTGRINWTERFATRPGMAAGR
ncbi:MAG TPA: inner membrane CreD family protein [Verrucomicrobiae bacterium]|jgi:inner membrane protein involved in colicin E2 resistance|nr:inner membrane CreD family protein [Verrucomicrobiae bacterium]